MRTLLLTTVLLLPLPAWAQDAALVLGIERYEKQDRVRRADDILTAVDRLAASGYEVSSQANGRSGENKDLASAFLADARDAERLIVALSGHFVTDGARTWLLSAEADRPNILTVENVAVSVDSLLQILATQQGQAVMVLGPGDPEDLDLGNNLLRAGVGSLDVPQGVTVIRAEPKDAGDVLSGPLSASDGVRSAVLSDDSSLTIEGFLPGDRNLLAGATVQEPREQSAAAPERTAPGPTREDLNAEAALWDRATEAETIEAYRLYVARYPNGRFVADAQARISAILEEPDRTARLTEEDLNLDRAARRAIQNQLTLLNYNTRGVDGIFGPGSRGAITNWQQTNGFPQTSFLTREQIDFLDAQAARRQAEIEAEQARVRAETEEQDRRYWAQTGQAGDEAGFRAYLDRFPEGLFSDVATARLAEIREQRLSQAQAAEREAWARAERADEISRYQDYLAAYPSGLFVDRARSRINDLSAPRTSNAEVAQARDEEASLGLSGLRAQLLELRLRDLGHNPGNLDGRIDKNTRRAIAAYQTQQGLTASGYVDKRTAVTLLTGALPITLPGQ